MIYTDVELLAFLDSQTSKKEVLTADDGSLSLIFTNPLSPFWQLVIPITSIGLCGQFEMVSGKICPRASFPEYVREHTSYIKIDHDREKGLLLYSLTFKGGDNKKSRFFRTAFSEYLSSKNYDLELENNVVQLKTSEARMLDLLKDLSKPSVQRLLEWKASQKAEQVTPFDQHDASSATTNVVHLFEPE